MSLPTKDDLKLDRILRHLDRLFASYSKPHDVRHIDSTRRHMQRVDIHKELGELSLVDSDDLRSWLRPLDHLFFGGMIFTNRITPGVEWLMGRTGKDYEDILGQVVVESGKITLRLCPRKHANSVQFLGTMLHEMVHVFIRQLAIREGVFYSWTMPSTDCFEVFGKLEGRTGHGYYFQKLARAVEDRARQLFHCDGIELGRMRAIVAEYQETKQIPTGEYFEEILKSPKYPNQPQPEAARDWIVRFDERERLRALHEAEMKEANNRIFG
ncbi:hypothetical protein PRZ48_005270 [Zasmidium cellare]|uniref:SprT-like domain-containing protein n=1 Tax=Zasmidium cellare TaxID=395010 RepID=A0ABR0ERY6_ZASCE|nr:hypothetical protein PRZ48_005270 [Zasmidium cellare]